MRQIKRKMSNTVEIGVFGDFCGKFRIKDSSLVCQLQHII
jgi:hypothetical protein